MTEETVVEKEKNKDTKPIDKAIDSRKVLSELDELRKALKEEQNRAEDYLNRLKYLQADFDNYKKRVNKDMIELVKYGNERLIIKLLDVVDNLERAMISGREVKNKETLLDGVEIIFKDLKEILRKEGVEEIYTIGSAFDPNLHEAIDKIETKDCPSNMIVEEMQKGYLLNDKLIRPSKVKVALNPCNEE